MRRLVQRQPVPPRGSRPFRAAGQAPSAVQVAALTIPVAGSLFAFWKATTAACVLGPNHALVVYLLSPLGKGDVIGVGVRSTTRTPATVSRERHVAASILPVTVMECLAWK